MLEHKVATAPGRLQLSQLPPVHTRQGHVHPLRPICRTAVPLRNERPRASQSLQSPARRADKRLATSLSFHEQRLPQLRDLSIFRLSPLFKGLNFNANLITHSIRAGRCCADPERPLPHVGRRDAGGCRWPQGGWPRESGGSEGCRVHSHTHA